MGYACPVCDVPQQDAEHLANHLAFTAMLHGSDHADWLDESVPDWREDGPAELAPKVADLAEASDYDAVFEDTTGGHADHDHAGRRQAGVDPAAAAGRGAAGDLDDETQSVVQEARAMTREMLDDGEGESADEATGDGEAVDSPEATTDGDEADASETETAGSGEAAGDGNS